MTEPTTEPTQSTVRDAPVAPVDETSSAAASIDPSGDLVGSVQSALAGLVQRPVGEHPAVYEGIHQKLGRTLAEIDEV